MIQFPAGIDASHFLRHYWQQKPLLIRQGLPQFQSPLSPDELAGLALETEIESRLVFERRGKNHWQVEQGPFDEKRLTTLPSSGWTLLVQGVDTWLDEVSALLDEFALLPRWRLDDVMVSYAPTGGSVGPHFDNYDVFLLQGAGKRRWKIGPRCDETTSTLPNTPLRIMANFETVEEHLLEPGDILYLPPRVAHWGVSEDDDCMTYSIGFRAPLASEMLGDLAFHLGQKSALSGDPHYTDPIYQSPPDQWAITDQQIGNLQQMLRHLSEQPELLAQWFGCFMTQPKLTPESMDDVDLQCNDYLSRHPATRIGVRHDGESATLFVNGSPYRCSPALANFLTSHTTFHSQDLMRASENKDKNVILELLAAGAWINTAD